jgi:hypothetical protein
VWIAVALDHLIVSLGATGAVEAPAVRVVQDHLGSGEA